MLQHLFFLLHHFELAIVGTIAAAIALNWIFSPALSQPKLRWRIFNYMNHILQSYKNFPMVKLLSLKKLKVYFLPKNFNETLNSKIIKDKLRL